MTPPAFAQIELPLQIPPGETDRLRHILLGARLVAYRLVRRRRKTLGMTVDQRGLRVGVPLRVGMQEVEDFVRSNGDWVLRKLDEWDTAARAKRLIVCEGAQLPLMGEMWTLRIVAGDNTVHWGVREIALGVCDGFNSRALLTRALKQRALELFRQRTQRYVRLIDRALPRLALTDARTRWGSCSSKTGLRFNWRLIHLPISQIDYVIAHELAHLVEMNHSKRFWQQVERLYPDYRRARIELRSQAPAAFRI